MPMNKPFDGGKNSRAPALAREAGGLHIEVVALRVPAGSRDRRNPVVLADTEIGPLTLRLGVFAMKRGRWLVRVPEAADRSEGVTLPPLLRDLVVDAVLAAVKADPEARDLLARR
jgi:hypothetical protein